MLHPCFLLFATLLPVLTGLIAAFTVRSERTAKLYSELSILAAAAVAWMYICAGASGALTLFGASEALSLRLELDGAGSVLLGVLCTLWPLTVLYASAYLKEQNPGRRYHGAFAAAFGCSIGAAAAGNLLTLLLFALLLCACCLSLILSDYTKLAKKAAAKIFCFMLGGLLLAGISAVYLTIRGAGCFSGAAPSGDATLQRVFFAVGALGLCTGTAIVPLHFWLPDTTCAPLPVSAMAVEIAFVNISAFGLLRLTYHCFEYVLLKESWAQYGLMTMSILSMLTAATLAMKEPHWKRRLAYSTSANMSYAVFAISLASPLGLFAALLQIAFHAAVKLLAFFCAGSVQHQTGIERVSELEGLGRRMPLTFAAFSAAALSLVGIPPFGIFVSKWSILSAAAASGSVLSYIGAGALLLAALLAAIYLLTAVCRAWFPGRDAPVHTGVREAEWRMGVPMLILAACALLCGLFAQPIVTAIEQAAGIG